MYAHWYYVCIIAHLLTLWHLLNDRLHLPTRENYCTFSPFCAGISSINGASSYFRTSREGDFWVLGVQILTPEIIFVSSRGHRFRVRKRPIPILMNVWLPGCKRLHPGLQTFASRVANACVWDDKPKLSHIKTSDIQTLISLHFVLFYLYTLEIMFAKTYWNEFWAESAPF